MDRNRRKGMKHLDGAVPETQPCVSPWHGVVLTSPSFPTQRPAAGGERTASGTQSPSKKRLSLKRKDRFPSAVGSRWGHLQRERDLGRGLCGGDWDFKRWATVTRVHWEHLLDSTTPRRNLPPPTPGDLPAQDPSLQGMVRTGRALPSPVPLSVTYERATSDPWHVEVPRLGLQLELWLLAYTTAIVTWHPSQFCDHHSPPQRWILNPPSKTRDRTCVLADTSQVCYCCATRATPRCATLHELRSLFQDKLGLSHERGASAPLTWETRPSLRPGDLGQAVFCSPFPARPAGLVPPSPPPPCLCPGSCGLPGGWALPQASLHPSPRRTGLLLPSFRDAGPRSAA
ncbi:uncharacterized protein LOC110255939 isoform X2 [Sus scrofa]|uniref:uncharacterized protein LOC110255939 isoform X2 n=1 Tax=Sus scrofa TaxID=9823 RepID=UPI000A2B1730|nr:uncharacterized protein LOC110255939 isoform X2 [Sus scrofa]